ncbi:MAG: flagellar M-ring protein FliF [Burkholderiaceae bacterium]|nr:flagellar M-ring protein FliF [Burkholderiaceae bacterium]
MDPKISSAATTITPVGEPAISINRLMALPLRNKLGLAAGTLLLAALAWAAVNMGREPEWRPLYASMNDRDGGAVLAALAQMNVPHKFSEVGGTFLVPANQVHEVRLRLASQGLPKGGTVGFEIMEGQKFGTTQFQERLNFQRGLEGELARSIMALSSVQTARVHLALPSQTAFMREQQKPSASVLLNLYGGRSLERGQVAGIVHLVASSVPDLQATAVSVVDQSGTLLSQVAGEATSGLNSTQLQYVRQTEQGLSSRVLGILEPIVGVGNVRAQVTADIDFTQSESTAELFAPNQGASPAAVRSQQLSEVPTGGAGGGGAGGGGVGGIAGGVPGALANQPPGTASSPVNGGAQTLSLGGAAGGGAAGGIKRDATTQYEVDKTIKVTRNASGNIKRLSAAIIVNHASITGPDGKTVLQALSPTQMEQINALAREAVGFSKDRGDSLNVVNAPFTGQALVAAPELPLWRQPEMQDLARSLAPWLALPLVALIIIFGLVRPAIRATRAPRQLRILETTVQDAISLPTPRGSGADPSMPMLPSVQAAQQQAREIQLEAIRQQAKQNPGTVANVVRNWVSQPT